MLCVCGVLEVGVVFVGVVVVGDVIVVRFLNLYVLIIVRVMYCLMSFFMVFSCFNSFVIFLCKYIIGFGLFWI